MRGKDEGEAAEPVTAEGFYDEALTEAERLRLPTVRAAEGIDEEIAVLRTRLHAMAEQRPQRLDRLSKGMGVLVRAVGMRYRMSPKSEESLAESLAGVLNGIGASVGLGEFYDDEER